MCQFVPNFLSYVSAEYYLNWITVGKVIIKIKRVNFLLRHNVLYTVELRHRAALLFIALTSFSEAAEFNIELLLTASSEISHVVFKANRCKDCKIQHLCV